MNPMSKSFWFLLIWVALVLIWGCRTDTPQSSPKGLDQTGRLLTQLTSPEESERFKCLEQAMKQVASFTRKDLENTLTALRPKNISTLVYVYLRTRNPTLYQLSDPATMALQTTDGAFPNIAYYYARVQPKSGVDVLLSLYRRCPDQRLPICLALGEIPDQKAYDFLLSEAKTIKMNGGDALSHLLAFKNSPKAFSPDNLFWLLDQKLNREEIITLSQFNVALTREQLQTLWQAGPVKQEFAVQYILKDPEASFAAFEWMIAQYLQAGRTDKLRQIMLSDTMQSATSSRVRQLRDAILKKTETDTVPPNASKKSSLPDPLEKEKE